MAVPPYTCVNCGHPARPNHTMAAPHACTDVVYPVVCDCEAYGYPPGVEASQFEGGGGSSGGGGASGGW